MPLVTRSGFLPLPDDPFVAVADLADAGEAVSVALDLTDDPAGLVPHFNRIALVAVPFPNSANGTGFSVAKRLRDLGYRGRLRARGPLIADQFPHALAVGFDEIEIDEGMAARQPEDQWHAIAANTLPPYRARRAG